MPNSGKGLDTRHRHNKIELWKIFLGSGQNQRLQISFTDGLRAGQIVTTMGEVSSVSERIDDLVAVDSGQQVVNRPENQEDFGAEEKPTDIVEENCGIELNVQTPEAIADVPEQFAGRTVAQCIEYGNCASSTAKEYDFKVLTKKLISVVEEI